MNNLPEQRPLRILYTVHWASS